MKNVEFLIIGGSAAGATAAVVIRSNNADASITIVSDEPHGYYSRVLLPNYIKHAISREQVIFKSPDWFKRSNIELLGGVKAEKLDAGKKQVTVSGGEVYNYQKLLIGVGGRPVTFNAPGADLENICYFSSLDDSDRIIKSMKGAQKAVVIGGGFIGLEFAEIFKVSGVGDVTILVMEPFYWFGKLDEDSSMVLTRTLEKNGIKVIVEEEVDHFEGEGKVSSIVTKTGRIYEAQVVGIGIGIRPNVEWLRGSGLEINRGIITNEYLETNLPDVYAAGDCAEFNDTLFERRHILGIWANAVNQGSVAAKNMMATPLRPFDSGSTSLTASAQGFEGFTQKVHPEGQGKTGFETASSYTSNFFDGTCSFVGVCDNKYADEIISRGSVESGKMTRIYIKTIGGVMRIVGATVINSAIDVAPLTMAIKGRVDVSTNRDKLSDISFNLAELMKF